MLTLLILIWIYTLVIVTYVSTYYKYMYKSIVVYAFLEIIHLFIDEELLMNYFTFINLIYDNPL